jgi:hypothetical protein
MQESDRCPTCKIGKLIRVEKEANHTVNHFSCGHNSHVLTVSETMTIKESIKLEKRLGPQSTDVVAHTTSHSTDILIVSMQQEMYQDSLHFYEEAKKAHAVAQENPFETWRNIRAAILFTFAAIESCVNQFIDTHVNQSLSTMSQKESDFWTEKSGYVSIIRKLNEGVELFGGKGKRLDSDTSLWKDFKELKELRDDLVHYKAEDRLFYDTNELLQRTEKGIRTSSAVIRKIYLTHPQNKAYPPVFDNNP